ncbi:MFS transporter [Lentzea sp. NBRC 105346]|uniref:MFS transporter n=1 Tax=Lentzea sp. NBRC 105346 TaxID=3032205 RepID=UPI0024A30B55|nr:MFS transporter [Lentzea sp. NBRC 105346]GLZ29517.1 MFS transporter [Lentzea sp. NBRC 105346]
MSVPLRRNSSFHALWVGGVTGHLGLEAVDVAYPLLVLAMTGSPGKAGVVASALLATVLVVGLPAGHIVDRYDRRRILLLSEGIRAVAAATIVIAMFFDGLGFAHLIVVAMLLGAAAPFAGLTRMLLVRAVVAPDQVTAALTAEEVRINTARLAGPPLGGLLYGMKAVLPFLFCAVAFAVSWLTVLFVRASPAAGSGPAGGLFEGIATLMRDAKLRVAVLLVTAMCAATGPLVLITAVVLERQDAPPWTIGLALSGTAVGGLFGAALVAPLHRRFRPGVVLLAVIGLEVPFIAALALPYGPWWVGGVLLLGSMGLPATRVLMDVLVFRVVPDEDRGKTMAAVLTLFSVGALLGTALTGFLLENLAPATSVLLLAGLIAAVVGWAATQQSLRRAEWPALV